MFDYAPSVIGPLERFCSGLEVWLAPPAATYGVRVGGVGVYLAQVDRVLGAGQALFPTLGPNVGGLGAVGPGVPYAPMNSQLGFGVAATGHDYRRSWDAANDLDARTNTAAAEGASAGQSGRAGATKVRTGAAAAAAAIVPSTNTPAGLKVLVSNMDDRLAEMQRQVESTKAQNRLLTMRLRQVVLAYRAAASLGSRHALPSLGGGPFGWAVPRISRGGSPPETARLSLTPGIGGLNRANREGAPLGGLTSGSTRREVAAAIIHEALRRGYSPRQTVAILSTALQESDLRPNAVSSNGEWESIFQQDSSYRNRGDPNAVIEQFFDRLGARGGPASPDIWKSIFWLQQRPGEVSAELAYEHGRRAYLGEIQSKLNSAAEIFRAIAGS
ncbi:hypothetical protein [Mycolicibacterium septicum]|uniref:hypothetical protein n=1 Tax=Mycolicibacterium septicum TaxID=98668 RepID=UPI00236226EB|nr:hypothetical protein [Mycolicibacterium septicum]